MFQMGVPHGARQQHSTSAPAAGPFSRDFNESFMFSRPLAPPAPRARAFPRRSPRPPPGRSFSPPAPRAALFPAAPRALPPGEKFCPPLPAPRFSPCRRPARRRPLSAPPAPPGKTSWQAHHLSDIMVALSMDGTPGGNGGGSISGSTGEPGAGGFGGAGTPAARRAIAPLPHGFRRATAPASAIERIKGGNRHALCRPD